MSPAPLALAVLGRGVVDPATPLLRADDEAVLRGRAAFETMRVYAGVPFRVDLHLRRLAESAQVLELPPPDIEGLTALVGDALASLERPDAVLRVVWTPGSGDGDSIGFVLVTPLPGFTLGAVLNSWVSFTAKAINKLQGRSGQFWQHEPYDHIVRNGERLRTLERYIAENPVKAKLREGEFLLGGLPLQRQAGQVEE